MPFLYHRARPTMEGTLLHPLNVLRDLHPHIYARAIAKYAGRETLLQRPIPILNCLWSDVLFLTPVHPSQIRDALKEAGARNTDSQYFEIPVERIDPARAVLLEYPALEPRVERRYLPFSVELLGSRTEVSAATRRYFAAEAAAGRPPMSYHGIPHILLKDSLDISGISVISV